MPVAPQRPPAARDHDRLRPGGAAGIWRRSGLCLREPARQAADDQGLAVRGGILPPTAHPHAPIALTSPEICARPAPAIIPIMGRAGPGAIPAVCPGRCRRDFRWRQPEAAHGLNIVCGIAVSTVARVCSALGCPDLVRENPFGNPNGKARAASAQSEPDKPADQVVVKATIAIRAAASLNWNGAWAGGPPGWYPVASRGSAGHPQTRGPSFKGESRQTEALT